MKRGNITVLATTYMLPADQGLFAGATPQGPAGDRGAAGGRRRGGCPGSSDRRGDQPMNSVNAFVRTDDRRPGREAAVAGCRGARWSPWSRSPCCSRIPPTSNPPPHPTPVAPAVGCRRLAVRLPARRQHGGQEVERDPQGPRGLQHQGPLQAAERRRRRRRRRGRLGRGPGRRRLGSGGGADRRVRGRRPTAGHLRRRLRRRLEHRHQRHATTSLRPSTTPTPRTSGSARRATSTARRCPSSGRCPPARTRWSCSWA